MDASLLTSATTTVMGTTRGVLFRDATRWFAGSIEEEQPVERRRRDIAQCSLSPADARRFPSGGSRLVKGALDPPHKSPRSGT